jgi:hypothetical protein
MAEKMPLQTYSQLFPTPGTYSFLVPAGVKSISIVAVNASATVTASYPPDNVKNDSVFDALTSITGGYVNNIPVTPGEQYNVVVGEGVTGGEVRIVWPGHSRQFSDCIDNNIDPPGPNSITIGTTDFIGSRGQGVIINTNGKYVGGLTFPGTGTIGNEYALLFQLSSSTLAQDIFAFFRQAGMCNINSLNYPGCQYRPTGFNAYIFNVTWADGRTGKVRMGWQGTSGQLLLSVIDTASTDWQIASLLTYPGPTNPALAGTFNFPATFTPHTPLIEANGDYWLPFND